MNERVSWIEVLDIPLHCWNYTSFKRIAGVWGELISLGENSTKVNSFDKLSMLVSINQSERIDDLIYLEVGKVNFSIRVVEIGLTEFFNDSNRGYGAKEKEDWESMQERDETFVSEFESAMRIRLEDFKAETK